jgi:basic membrane protein A
VIEIIKLNQGGKFPAGNYFGQVGLAPFHDFDAKISQDIKSKLANIEKRLKKGSKEAKDMGSILQLLILE